MAQPAQVFTPGAPEGEYVVIDNGAPGNQGGFFGGPGYDTIAVGAVGQSQNVFKNGNIPDFVAAGKTFTCSTAVVATPIIISYKLPS